MRNPFARVARPAAARPTLRDRAAALKASTSRVIRCKPVDAAPVLAAVQADAVREARRRIPADDWEQKARLGTLAQDTIENGDKGAMLAFARDLQVMG